MSGLTQQLAQFIVNPSLDAGCSDAFTVAKTGIADTTATMFAGCAEPVVGILLQHYAHLAGSSGCSSRAWCPQPATMPHLRSTQ